jgi:diaminopimelate decarboxylase
LKEFQSLGIGATLVSGNELKLALEAGFEPSSLMFNGGGKSTWETHLAVKVDLFSKTNNMAIKQ